jgi:hypothetical protein
MMMIPSDRAIDSAWQSLFAFVVFEFLFEVPIILFRNATA